LRYGVHTVLRTHRLTESLTDGHTQKEYASGTGGFQGQRHNNYIRGAESHRREIT